MLTDNHTGTDAEPVNPTPWTFSFNGWDPEHCFGAVNDILDDLDVTVRATLALPDDLSSFDHDDLRSLLSDQLGTTRELLADLDGDAGDPHERAKAEALETKLEEAYAALEPHDSCVCAMDAWTGRDQDVADDMLANETVRNVTWVLFQHGVTPVTETGDSLHVTAVFDCLESRDGWESVDLSWDPDTRTVSFEFGCSPSTWFGRATALTAEQCGLANKLQDLDPYLENPGAIVLDTSAPAVDLTCLLWGDQDAEGTLAEESGWDIEQAVHNMHELLAPLDSDAQTAVRGLADGWTSDLATLFATATTVAAAA